MDIWVAMSIAPHSASAVLLGVYRVPPNAAKIHNACVEFSAALGYDTQQLKQLEDKYILITAYLE